MPKRSRGLEHYINGWTIGAVLTVFIIGSLVCLAALLKYASLRANGKSSNVIDVPYSLGGTPSAEREGIEWSCDDLGKWFVKKGFAKDYQVNMNFLTIRLNDGMETILDIVQRDTVFDAEEATKTKHDRDGILEHNWDGSNRICWGRFVATEPIYKSGKNNIPMLRRYFSEMSGAKEKKDTLSTDRKIYIRLLQPLRKTYEESDPPEPVFVPTKVNPR